MTDNESGLTISARMEVLTSDARTVERERDRLANEVERLMIQCAELMGEIPKEAYIQQLHEALLFYEDPRSYVAENPFGARIWRDRGRRAARAMGLRVREDER